MERQTAELAEANAALRRSVEELQAQRAELQATHQQKNEYFSLLATTLRSVGDAVISTDAQGRVRFMNSVAESLTGWPEAEGSGRPLQDVFKIVNERTREPVESPVSKVIRAGSIVGLANHNGAHRARRDRTPDRGFRRTDLL